MFGISRKQRTLMMRGKPSRSVITKMITKAAKYMLLLLPIACNSYGLFNSIFRKQNMPLLSRQTLYSGGQNPSHDIIFNVIWVIAKRKELKLINLCFQYTDNPFISISFLAHRFTLF